MLKKNQGITLVDTLIGAGILVIVMLGLYGLFQLGIRVSGQSKARITATALANEKIETIHNLSYNDIGTIGGIPQGLIEETATTTINGIPFTIRTTIFYVDDPFDGQAPADPVPNDYKRVKVRVSWEGFFASELILVTDIAPSGLEATEGGGNLLVSVFNAVGAPIGQANIYVVNTETDPAINSNYLTNDQGQFLIAGAPTSTEAYQLTITKSGYSSARTYSTTEIANPDKPHASVMEGQLTEISFSIDILSSLTVNTLSPWGTDSFADTFLNSNNISDSADILVKSNEVTLATTSDGFVESGFLLSSEILPDSLLNWNELSFDHDIPLAATLNYQLLFATSSDWQLVPDADLGGNAIGFNSSPIDLSGLDIADYPKLKIRGNLGTANTSTTPTIFDWSVSWITSVATPIGNVSFNLQGDKTIGTDGAEQPVYKFSNDYTTNASGQITVGNLEWDQYDFLISVAENLDLVSTDPESDPLGQNMSLLPNEDKIINLYLDAENSLLITLINTDTLEPIFNGQIRLYNGGSYDTTLFSDNNGQAIFIPLDPGNYSLEIQADGYANYSGSASISGDNTKNVSMQFIGPT